MSRQSEAILNNARLILENVDLHPLEGKTILITGASGLIGMHFLASLKLFGKALKTPVKVIAVINSNPEPYLRELLNDTDEVYQGDLTDIKFCESLPKADYIVHAASYGQPIRFMENPLKTLKLNTLATYILFEKLMPNGKFLFISSSELYIGLTDPPFNETQIGSLNTNHLRACYVEAKRCGETIVNAYRNIGVDAKSARLALAYGPGTKLGDKRVISSFIQKSFEGAITLLDYGTARRAYLYVTDAVEIMWRILLDGTDGIYNVGGVGVSSIADLAKTIGRLMDVPVNFPNNPEGVTGSPEASWLDMSKAGTEFGKENYVTLEQGLHNTIEWYRLLYEAIK